MTHAMVRFSGELSTKAKRTRGRFQKRLARNLRDGFEAEGAEATLLPDWSRFYIEAPDDRFALPLTRTFGVSSFSLVLGTCEADLDTIVELGTELYAERVKGRTYAVRARRSGTPGFTSADVQQRLGAALNPGATVNLSSPEVSVNVELRDGTAYFYGDSIPCASGLPLGVQGRALALISGGFDSSVAAWMALRRGVTLDYVFCNLGGTAYQRMVVEVTKVLSDHWSYGTYPRLHVLEFGPVVEAMRERAKPAYLQVVLKRMFYRAASKIAEEIGAEAIVTGESIGQVSSQTLTNLTAIEDASSLPVLRPLLGFHKEEIIDRCREIGTYEISSRIREYCEVSPAKPVTAASREDATEQEMEVGHEELETAIGGRQVLDLRRVRPEEIAGAALYVTKVPAGAVVIDTRPAAAFDAWHWPGSTRRNLEDVEAGYRELDRTETYVLLCAEGIRTAYVAEQMQRDGYEAYSFLGGAPRLRRDAGVGQL
ncbi:MAG: tRNA 4-thiouridine(8) synthase ThiI [Gemmatimonadota bacterium]|nr:tRNA 4-thiouridine(8) synthase ThiI [Gemmatimonadota bacterium]